MKTAEISIRPFDALYDLPTAHKWTTSDVAACIPASWTVADLRAVAALCFSCADRRERHDDPSTAAEYDWIGRELVKRADLPE